MAFMMCTRGLKPFLMNCFEDTMGYRQPGSSQQRHHYFSLIYLVCLLIVFKEFIAQSFEAQNASSTWLDAQELIHQVINNSSNFSRDVE